MKGKLPSKYFFIFVLSYATVFAFVILTLRYLQTSIIVTFVTGMAFLYIGDIYKEKLKRIEEINQMMDAIKNARNLD